MPFIFVACIIWFAVCCGSKRTSSFEIARRGVHRSNDHKCGSCIFHAYRHGRMICRRNGSYTRHDCKNYERLKMK
ncbi:MAG: hypothetical protein ACRC92_25955 [Peptostreptococcaceae bacterium]